MPRGSGRPADAEEAGIGREISPSTQGRRAIGAVDCPRNGFDVLLASLVVEILNTPFCYVQRMLALILS